jgi:hypothetical protein
MHLFGFIHDLSGSKLEAEKVKVDVREVAVPVHILAVDDLRLLRMQHQLAGRKAVGNRAPECPRLRLLERHTHRSGRDYDEMFALLGLPQHSA